MSEFYVSLGSNLGDREENLASAVARLRAEGVGILRISSIYETEPVGAAAGPGWFLNMAVGGETELRPAELLARHEGAPSSPIRRSFERTLAPKPGPAGPSRFTTDGSSRVASRSLTVPPSRGSTT